MEFTTANLNREELVMQKLRFQFAKYGYSRYRMGKFESYDMYHENKAFLNDEKIITFTDGTGKLMALKPDVTMSIVKNLPKSEKTRKVYYSENVFRMRAPDSEYKEIAQMGVEYIGDVNCYSEAEIILLAAESLSIINNDYVLNISHMGFLNGILENADISYEMRGSILKALRSKNSHTLTLLINEANLPEDISNSLVKMVTLSGSFLSTLKEAETLCINEQVRSAYNELINLYTALENTDIIDNLILDLSIINDDEYYNGTVLKGFVRGVPRAVLEGGRYDKLMRRFDKPQCAIGFALYLGELSRMLTEKVQWDVNSLLLYNTEQSPKFVMNAVQTLGQQGSVRAETFIPEGYSVKKIYTLESDGSLKEEKFENKFSN